VIESRPLVYKRPCALACWMPAGQTHSGREDAGDKGGEPACEFLKKDTIGVGVSELTQTSPLKLQLKPEGGLGV
jgi:hypothetical protein